MTTTTTTPREARNTPLMGATSVSHLLRMKVMSEDGELIGEVLDFAVDVAENAGRVAGFVLEKRKGRRGQNAVMPVSAITLPKPGDRTLKSNAEPEHPRSLSHYVLLDYDVLDQQIIDVDGRKVVRVNDVNLRWEVDEGTGKLALEIETVEVGTRGASRRLLKGLPEAAVEAVSRRIPERVIPWEYVDLIDRDPTRRVRLKIGQDRLASLHPADIAEILADLAPAEREAVFASLPEETAAEALEEFEPKLQKEIVERLDEERAAEIIEEMDPGAAADLLSELAEEKTEAILDEMEPEERSDVEELLEFRHNTAAGLMTTDFIALPQTATVSAAIHAFAEFEGDPDTITEIYLATEKDHLAGVVTLPKILLAAPGTKLSALTSPHTVSCRLHAADHEVAELFDKYNLRSLPVLDEHGEICGAVHAEQVIGHLLAE